MADETIADDASSNHDNFGAVWKFAHVETPELSTTTLAREHLRRMWHGLVLVVYQCNITVLKSLDSIWREVKR